MKQQDINTVIKEGLEKGEGIAYKDEHWSKMNDLLNESMPVNTPQSAAANIAKVSKGLKLATIVSISTTIGVTAYYTLFSSSSLSTQSNNQTHSKNEQVIIENSDSSFPNHHANTTNKSEENSITDNNYQLSSPANTTDNAQENNIADNNNSLLNPTLNAANKTEDIRPIDNNTSAHATIKDDNAVQKNAPKFSFGKHTNNNINKNKQSLVSIQYPVSITSDPINNSSVIQSKTSIIEEGENANLVIAKTVDFNLIVPAENYAIGIKSQYQPPNKSALLKYPNRNGLIKHASISPFIGANHTSKDYTYTSGKISYTSKKQTHLVAGLNLQLESKYFALRTGLGISTTLLHSSFQSIENTYTNDTSYTIVNANYQTTSSGKPIALIRQQIDSSLSSSQTHINNATTEYRYIIIPLTIQYRLARKRYSFLVEGGALHNFIISNQSGNSINLESSNKQASIPFYTLQFTAGTGVGYALNAKYTIEAQYNFAFGKTPSSSINLFNNTHMFTIMLTRNLW